MRVCTLRQQFVHRVIHNFGGQARQALQATETRLGGSRPSAIIRGIPGLSSFSARRQIPALKPADFTPETPLLSIIQAAGWPIWPLILCSIVALALVIERLFQLRSSLVAPASLLDEVIGFTRASLPAADAVNKLADNSVLGSVLAAGLRSVIAEPRIS